MKMVFQSKIDRSFLLIIAAAILLIGGVTWMPIWLDEESTVISTCVMFAIFSISAGFILWVSFSIRYTFQQNRLLLKAGPFRSRIPYGEITKITPTKDVWTGYRMLSSKDSYELFYQSAIFGSVKISPKEPERFLSELEKRCPNLTIQN
ncbi:PH domain-containing protein [Bacillus sp. 1P06AnD]|uniref:PH domain-containing protein n=1 Tax=Bacillus sp. 1P06AnD TaxID=3132208 RepID=UPI0039A0C559